MGGWCKDRYNEDENNKLEELHQKPDQMEETRWEGQNFSEVVVSQEEGDICCKQEHNDQQKNKLLWYLLYTWTQRPPEE